MHKFSIVLLTLLLSIGNASVRIPDSFLRLPIQTDGRLKPLETFARHNLLEFSGKSTIRHTDSTGSKIKMSSSEWLLHVLFSPEQVAHLPVFLIENPEVRDALELSGKERDRYSWHTLEPQGKKLGEIARLASFKENKLLTPYDKDVLRLADAYTRYRFMLDALIFFRNESMASMPLSQAEWQELQQVLTLDSTTKHIQLPKHPPVSFWDFANQSKTMGPLLETLMRRDAQTSLEASHTPRASERHFLMWTESSLRMADRWSASEFATFPMSTHGKNGDVFWESPGKMLYVTGAQNPVLQSYLQHLHDLQQAWVAQDQERLDEHAHALTSLLEQQTSSSVRLQALQTEQIYNRLEPFYKAILIFFVALLLAVVSFLKKDPLKKRGWNRLSAWTSFFALVLMLIGMGMRAHITLRPPVTNLYETFIFVGATAVALILWGAKRWRWDGGPLAASFAGAMLLLISRRHGADGDSMPVLVAVLDSNFWLTVHVITISLGYAGVVASGVAAHVHLVYNRLLTKGKDAFQDRELRSFNATRGLQAFGLLMTFIGTLLGGIWADQSWGRFWGWDPKENGALLIVLWSAILFHGIPAGLFTKRGFSIGAVLGINVVLFAWFGVNLLGVGLHSYGFTEGTAIGLAVYALLDLTFLGWVLVVRKK